MRRYSRHRLELRHRFYEILEQGPIGNWVGRLAGSLIVLLIVINLFAVVLESVPEYEARYAVLFGVIEILSLAVFTSEYLMRIWVAVEHAPCAFARLARSNQVCHQPDRGRGSPRRLAVLADAGATG